MKTGKFYILSAVLLLLVMAVAPTAFSGLRDRVAVQPIDDQPWGGEIDARDYGTHSISSISPIVIQPDPIFPSTISNVGTGLVLFDFVRTIFVKNFVSESSPIKSTQVSAGERTVTTSYVNSPIRSKMVSFRKGR